MQRDCCSCQDQRRQFYARCACWCDCVFSYDSGGYWLFVLAGTNPLVALFSTVSLGFMAAAFGGRPGVISGASGACSVVIAALVASHGTGYLSACVVLAGILQCFRVCGSWEIYPFGAAPCDARLCQWLAVVMTRAQMSHFLDSSGASAEHARLHNVGIDRLDHGLIKLIPKLTGLLPLWGLFSWWVVS